MREGWWEGEGGGCNKTHNQKLQSVSTEQVEQTFTKTHKAI